MIAWTARRSIRPGCRIGSTGHIRSLAVNRAIGGNVLSIEVFYREGTLAYPRPAGSAFVPRAVSP